MSQFIAGFEVLEKIGEGGMGVVFKARDPQLDRVVALKLVRHAFDNQKLRDRFRQEARAAARLDNRHIVTIYAFGEHGGTPYIAMEFVHGTTLGHLIRSKTAISLIQKLEIIETLCGALGYAHSEGVVHRDIKPSNLMLNEKGILKILDFGLARALRGSGLTHTHSIMGTPNYMSPEQFGEPRAVDKRTDIFAVGAVMYELLSYEQAFPGELMEAMNLVLKYEPRPLSDCCPQIDRELDSLVFKALTKDPNGRFQDLKELESQVRHVRRRLEMEVPEPTVVRVPLPEIVGIHMHLDSSAEPSSEELSPWQETAPQPPGVFDNGQRTERRAERTQAPVRVVRERNLLYKAVGGRWAVITVLGLATGTTVLVWSSWRPDTGARTSTSTSAVERPRSAAPPPTDKVASSRSTTAEETGTGLGGHVAPPTPQLVDVSALVRRSQTARRRGDLRAATALLAKAVALNPSDAAVGRDLDVLLRAAKSEFENHFSKIASGPRAPAASEAYEEANKRRQEANRLAQAGDKIQAATLYIAARQSLDRVSTASTNPPIAAPETESPTGTLSSERVATGPAALPEVLGTKVPRTKDSTLSSPPEPPATSEVIPPSVPTTADPEADRKQILSVLEEYKEGYERLDARRIRRVWPLAPSDLESSLANFERYQMRLFDEQILIEGDGARVTCIREITAQPSAGRRQSRTLETIILLKRENKGWFITAIR